MQRHEEKWAKIPPQQSERQIIHADNTENDYFKLLLLKVVQQATVSWEVLNYLVIFFLN